MRAYSRRADAKAFKRERQNWMAQIGYAILFHVHHQMMREQTPSFGKHDTRMRYYSVGLKRLENDIAFLRKVAQRQS